MSDVDTKRVKLANGGEDINAEKEAAEEDDEQQLALLDDLRNRVFNEELLMEKILDFAMQCETNCTVDSELYPLVVQSCRLTSTNWLLGVTKCLRKTRRPLFHLEIEENLSGLLEVLTSFYSSFTSRFEGRPPPLKLTIHNVAFFHRENHAIFSEILRKAGENLVELELWLPRDGGTMTFVFPQLYLPNLRKLVCNFTVRSAGQSSEGEYGFEEDNFGNVNLTYFLQSIFNASRNLKIFKIDYRIYTNSYLMPDGFDFLALPQSITGLSLIAPLNLQNLKILQRSGLPALTDLQIHVAEEKFDGKMIAGILQKLSKSLKSFSLAGERAWEDPTSREGLSDVIVPFMEKLEKLEVASPYYWDLSQENTNLEQNLPKLRKLSLIGLPLPMFLKWVDGRRFENVEQLCISPGGEDILEPVAVTADIMKGIHSAFPNITYLHATISSLSLDGIKYLFENMKKLEAMNILLSQNAEVILDSTAWDTLLTGLSKEDISKWKDNPEDFVVPDGGTGGITNMTELRSLGLNSTDGTNDERQPLISDAAFQHAFFKMSKLKNLYLKGRFTISPEMMERWKALDKNVSSTEWEDVVMPIENEAEEEDEEDDNA